MKNRIYKMLALIMIFTIVLTGCAPQSIDATKGPQPTKKTQSIPTETLEVHFIDVGQGDSIFIKQGKQTMLIDAGDNKYGKTVVDYLKNQNVEKLNYVIGTHPHADHIGGLDDVLNTFKADTIIMPNKMHTTKTFEDVLKAINKQGAKITTPKVGDVYQVGQAKFTILAPNKNEYKNLNDYSVSIKLEMGEKSFFFSGDCETQAEKEITQNGHNIKSTVMKAGHHGSNTSNTNILLDKVQPEFVVIQVGEGNKYNHPNKDIMDKFEAKGIKVYRNDIHGNVIVKTNGKTIDFTTDKENTVAKPTKKTNNTVTKPKPKVNNGNKAVKTTPKVKPKEKVEVTTTNLIGTKTTKKVHFPDCRHVPKKENQVEFANFQEAQAAGYVGCKVCEPY